MAWRCATCARNRNPWAISFFISSGSVARAHDFEIACPREAEERGSQVALRHPEGYAIMQALIAQGVIGDFRAPDVFRFGFAPLYTRYVDMWDAIDRLAAIMDLGLWRDARFRTRAAVT